MAGEAGRELGSCAEGYQGLLCATCSQGHYKKSWLECEECAAYFHTCLWALLRFGWFTIFVLGVTALIETIAEAPSGSGNEVEDKRIKNLMAMLGQMKLMVNHCVILHAIDAIKYDWTPMVRATLSWQTRVAQIVAKNISFSCLLMGPNESHDPALHTFFKELICAALLPLILIVWCGILIHLRSNTSLSRRKVSFCCGRCSFE